MGKDSSRVIGFLDMDSFEVQIYLKYFYQRWQRFYLSCAIILADGQRIISVNPIAKSFGLSREDRVNDAISTCQDLLIMQKKRNFNKPESKSLRHSSWDVLDSIVEYRRKNIKANMKIEYSPSDEFYFDLTNEVNYRINRLRTSFDLNPNGILESKKRYLFRSFPQKIELQELRFMIGSMILDEIRNAVYKATKFWCSVGVSENKLLSKFACSLNKPNGTTVLTFSGFNRIANDISITKLKGLGGEFGQEVIDGLTDDDDMTIEDVRQYKKKELKRYLNLDGNDVRHLTDIVSGVCYDQVVEKLMTNGVAVSKTNYRNPSLYINRHRDVRDALEDLCDEISERLDEELHRHQRVAEFLQVHIWLDNSDKQAFQVKLPYLKRTYYVNTQCLLNRMFQEFENEFQGWEGRVSGIRLSAKPKVSC